MYRGDGLNLYAYCGNNPVMYVDPSGYEGNKCSTKREVENNPEGVTYDGPLYRNVGTLPNGDPVNPLDMGEFTLQQNYRYTQNGVNGIYFASSQHVMEGEMGAYNSNPYADIRTTYHYDNVKLSNMLDLTNPKTRTKLNINLSDLLSSDYKNYTTTNPSPAGTHTVGRFASENGYSGLIVPSARADGGVNLVIFQPSQIDFGTYTTIHEK